MASALIVLTVAAVFTFMFMRTLHRLLTAPSSELIHHRHVKPKAKAQRI